MPSTVGIVASGEDVLNDAVFWVDAGRSSVVSGALSNLGTGGSALNAVFGNSTGVDSFDPALLTHTGTNYLLVPTVANNYASAPHNNLYRPTSSVSVRFSVSLDAWKPTAVTYLGGHYDGATGQRSYLMGINATSGVPFINLSSDGINAPTITASQAPTVNDGERLAIRADWSVTGPVVRFYTKVVTSSVLADLTSDADWTQLGLDRTTSVPASLWAATSVMNVAGYPNANGANTKFYASAVKVDGTLQCAADFTTGITSGSQTTFTESSANAATVTINRSTSGRKAVAVTRSILLFGTDDYLEVADNDLLDFAAGEPFTVAVVTRQWNTFTSQGVAIAKKTGNGTTGTGWLIRNGIGAGSDGTALDTYDGTTSATRAAPTSKTSGALCVITGIASSSQLTAYFNNTASAATTRQAGGYANSEVMRIGRLSGASTQYVDMELLAAAVWRRALNANEIATIVARYT